MAIRSCLRSSGSEDGGRASRQVVFSHERRLKFRVVHERNTLVTLRINGHERIWGAGWFQQHNIAIGSRVNFKDDQRTRSELKLQNRYVSVNARVWIGVSYKVVNVVHQHFVSTESYYV